jgi:RNA polymerase sigma-70 factor, ECF subfamily
MPPDHAADSVERRLLSGDRAALGLVSRWIAFVITAPRFWSLKREWPDLHQEVLRRIVESLERGRFQPGRDFRSYVEGVARNTAREICARRTEVYLATLPELADDRRMEDEADARMFARRVLDGSTPACRELMRLHFMQQMSYEEMAELLNLPIGTVKSKLFRCLACARRNRSRPGLKLDR